jgi:hypothetical protein
MIVVSYIEKIFKKKKKKSTHIPSNYHIIINTPLKDKNALHKIIKKQFKRKNTKKLLKKSKITQKVMQKIKTITGFEQKIKIKTGFSLFFIFFFSFFFLKENKIFFSLIFLIFF